MSDETEIDEGWLTFHGLWSKAVDLPGYKKSAWGPLTIARERATQSRDVREGERIHAAAVLLFLQQGGSFTSAPDSTITEEELLAIEARVNKATLGPWRADVEQPDDVVIWGSRPTPDNSDFLGNIGEGRISEVGVAFDFDADNAQFIAGARTDIPRLIAEIRALWAKQIP
jgi:hypothetical protein